MSTDENGNYRVHMIIGQPGNNQAFIFKKNRNDVEWTQEAELSSLVSDFTEISGKTGSNANFGISVA
jgi:hypothetical protein